jgi:hypothetical protein
MGASRVQCQDSANLTTGLQMIATPGRQHACTIDTLIQ